MSEALSCDFQVGYFYGEVAGFFPLPPSHVAIEKYLISLRPLCLERSTAERDASSGGEIIK